jgi:hypothetical protein
LTTQARATLDRARYFLGQADTCAAGNDWSACETNLLAAMQFGRNVTFQLQSELAREAWFGSWYLPEQERMRTDAQMVFFRDSRSAIVHERPPRVETRETTRTHLSSLVMGWIVVEPDPPGRWFTWGPRTILRVWRARLKRPFDRLALKVLLRTTARQDARLAGTAFKTEDLYFADPVFGSKSARSLVREYLSKLGEILSRAEEARANMRPS